MAAILLNLTGFQFGFPSVEIGVNIAKITTKIDSKKLIVPDIQGAGRGHVDFDPSDETTLDGEMSGTTGVAAAMLATALVIANAETVDHGAGVAGTNGTTYVFSLTIEKGREELKKITVNTTRRPGY